jgi:flagellar basal body-associated protein FliL
MACTPEILSNLETYNKFFTWLSGKRSSYDDSTLDSLRAYSGCLNEKINEVSSSNSSNTYKMAKITTLNKEIKDAVNDLEISQDRALLVRHPEMSRSYYEGILPIGRPIAHYTVPILIGVSTFFLSLSFFMLLSMFRIDSVITVPRMSQSSTSESRQLWIMRVVIIVLLALTIYAFIK